MLFNINNLQKIYCVFKSTNLSFIAIFTIYFQSFSSLEAKICEKDSVIKIVFVTNRNGIQLKQKVDTNSAAPYSVQFGDRLEVIQDSAEWYGIRFLIGDGWPKTTEKLYVLKNSTGLVQDLDIISSELNIINSIYNGSKWRFFESGTPLNEFIQIELVSQQLYDSMKETVTNLFSFDSSQFSKKNGVLSLKCEKKIRKFKDVDGRSEDEMKMYDYSGQYSFLNQFIVLNSYYETGNFNFVDKSSGKITEVFGNFPKVSPNKNHILCVGLNQFELTGQLELFSIKDLKTKHIFSASFPKWFPNGDEQEMFWGSDNCFYFPVNNIFYLSANPTSPKFHQCIRIKIL